MTRGPKLFDLNCGVCHKFSPTPERPDYPGCIKGPFKASDLANYASDKWIRGLLTTPNDPNYFGLTKLTGMTKWREKVDGERAEWLKENAEVGKKKIADQEEQFDLTGPWLAPQQRNR